MSEILLVAIAAAVGAMGRWLAEALLNREPDRFPWGTLGVNVAGSLLAGSLIAASESGRISPEALIVLGVGLTGALTTYSGFAYRVVLDLRQRRVAMAWVYSAASFLGCIGAASLGYLVGG